ncbi:hypothetical protein [Nitrosopumilus maritimus]|uniref:Fe2OG dioxygenase domain-containing protein n=1 Tax=Nitrosopumilus maritimus (strain SCM1) TaxID=436308 RepID=A9A1Q9_NITMS|nr:hypothetical protein [Nitrosopumilus maritimus]ABX12030.1 hypothetical protein Nmar_0130 [Nitrosopumilus maritimus SCM1]
MKILEVNVLDRNRDECKLDKSIDEIKENILSKNLVIIKNLLSQKEAQEIREFSREFAKNNHDSCPEIDLNIPNFHRIDNNPEKSQVKRINHLYCFFYWNSETNPIANYFKRQFRLRNLISGLKEDYALNNLDDDFISIPSIQQYPCGGGYMQEHKDPDIGQKLVIDTILSSAPKDYKKGGLFVRDENNEKLFVDNLVSPGDAIAFYPQISHGVDPIDPDSDIDWNRDDGRWMCFSTLTTLSSWKGIKDKASPKPVTN